MSRNLQTGAMTTLCRGSFGFLFLPRNQGLLVLTNDSIEVWDFAPRRPVVLLLTLAAVPSLLFTLLLWWRCGR